MLVMVGFLAVVVLSSLWFCVYLVCRGHSLLMLCPILLFVLVVRFLEADKLCFVGTVCHVVGTFGLLRGVVV